MVVPPYPFDEAKHLLRYWVEVVNQGDWETANEIADLLSELTAWP